MYEANRLKKVKRKAIGSGGGDPGTSGFSSGGGTIPFELVARFYHDALGRRIRTTYFDQYQQITDDTLYYYDGQKVLAEVVA